MPASVALPRLEAAITPRGMAMQVTMSRASPARISDRLRAVDTSGSTGWLMDHGPFPSRRS